MLDLQHEAVFWDKVPEPPDFDSASIQEIVAWFAIFSLPGGEMRKIINYIQKKRKEKVVVTPSGQE